ncbi:hypothetical protein Tco_0596815 [Tanacetum coccineum]
MLFICILIIRNADVFSSKSLEIGLSVQIDIFLSINFGLSDLDPIESRLKSGDLNSSRLRVLKCFLDDRNSRAGSLHSAQNRNKQDFSSVLDDRYDVSPMVSGYGRDEVICTTPKRENDEFIKSSIDDLVLIPRESEVTLVCDDLECDMHVNTPLPTTDVLGEAIVNIDLPLREHLNTLSTGDRKVNFNPSRDIEELECLLADDLVPVPRVFDEPLGNSDSPGPPESTPVIDESTLLVTPLPASKQLSLREVERFDLFFSLTQSGEETRVMEIPSFSSYHMPSPRLATYSPTEFAAFDLFAPDVAAFKKVKEIIEVKIRLLALDG